MTERTKAGVFVFLIQVYPAKGVPSLKKWRSAKRNAKHVRVDYSSLPRSQSTETLRMFASAESSKSVT